MRQCIIHFGLHKTGTSSIQEALYAADCGPGTTYLHFETPYIGRKLKTAFCRPAWRLVSDLRDVSPADRRAARTAFRRLVDGASGERLLLSAEDLSHFEDEELADLFDCLRHAGLALEAVAYVRDYHGWCESFFQQAAKYGNCPVSLFPLGTGAYRFAIDKFDRLLGREQVRLWKYDRSRFPQGCVVRDFFRRLGLPGDPVVDGEVNTGLSLDAIKLLRAFHRSNLRPVHDTAGMIRSYWLTNHMRGMPGAPVRFHRDLVEQQMRHDAADLDWIEERLGESVRLTRLDDPPGEAIRHEAELDDFSPASLAWLSRESGVIVGHTSDRQHLSLRVARAMAVLQDRILANPNTSAAPHVSGRGSSQACSLWRRATKTARSLMLRCVDAPAGDGLHAASREPARPSGDLPLAGDPLPRTIWVFWSQGREKAPWVVQRCIDSWEEMNPGWTLRVLDADEAEPFLRRAAIPWRRIESMRIDQRSAVLRLRLLSEVGGVWTDATNFCLQPLDEWLPECMGGGLFAFRDICPFVMVSNWFLAASASSRLAELWRDELERFWASKDYLPHSSYPGQAAPELPLMQRWLLRIFHRLFDRDTRTTDLWFHPAVRLVFRSYPYCVMLYLFSRGCRQNAEWGNLASRMAYRPAKPILAPYDLVEEGRSFEDIIRFGHGQGLPLLKFNWKRPPVRAAHGDAATASPG